MKSTEQKVIVDMIQKFSFDIVKFSLLMISLLLIPILLPSVGSAQSPDTITINGTVKEGDYVSTNLYFQNTTISFGSGSDICPDKNCLIEFQDTTFNEFGQDRIISGTLKVENKTNADPEFRSFDYYKISGTFHLSNSKENIKSGEKILIFEGNLGIDKADAIFNPEFEYKSKAQLAGDKFQLNGTNTKKFFGS